VSFANGAYGTIGLACTVPGIANGMTPSQINAFAFSLINSGQGCVVSGYLVDRTTGLNTGFSISQSLVAGNLYTVEVPLTDNTYPLNQTHRYEVDIYLSRTQSEVNQCIPTVYGAFLEYAVIS